MLEQPKAQDATQAKVLEMKTMAYQQENPSDAPWLGGLWDGEGSIFITHSRESGHHKTSQYSPGLCLTNSNVLILEKVIHILDGIGVTFHMLEKGQGGFAGSIKQCWKVEVRRFRNCIHLLDYLEPWLVGKRVQAVFMRRFINSRIKVIGSGRGYGKRYLPEDVEFVNAVFKANGDQRKNLRDSNPPSNRFVDMVESELHRDMQKAGETLSRQRIWLVNK